MYDTRYLGTNGWDTPHLLWSSSLRPVFPVHALLNRHKLWRHENFDKFVDALNNLNLESVSIYIDPRYKEYEEHE
jgi:hypothetical protein